MPVAISYPGVYIEEIPSGVRTITGVATSITAFLGVTIKGPENEPVMVNSFGDFDRRFGGLAVNSPLSYAVRDFYLNGGSQALIVRLYVPPALGGNGKSKLTAGVVALEAENPGEWGRKLRMTIDSDVSPDAREELGLESTALLFNLTVRLGSTTEKFLNLSVADNKRRIDRVLASQSNLVRWAPDKSLDIGPIALAHELIRALKDARKSLTEKLAATPPVATDVTKAKEDVTAAEKSLNEAVITAKKTLTEKLAATPPVATDVTKAKDDVTAAEQSLMIAQLPLSDAASRADADLAATLAANPLDLTTIATKKTAVKTSENAMQGEDSSALVEASYTGIQAEKSGLFALDKADLFNLLCILPDKRDGDVPAPVWQAAMAYCAQRRAMLVVDPPTVWDANTLKAASTAKEGLATLGLSGPAARNAALYFPRLLESNPLRDGQIEDFVPCGAVAGIMARTDSARGVWKAPAGLDAAINGIQGLTVNLNDAENGMLNPLGINCLRAFPINGRVVWGARTLRGADQLADEYKYVSVRRTALFIEETLYRGTQWVVFEPNDEPLWSQIRLNIGAFMNGLFRQGAFQGKTPAEAYFVKCDKETTPQNDIDKGIVNIVVGFAPLKPAEFVIVKLQQIAGQIQV
jgi:uncharacterized protein